MRSDRIRATSTSRNVDDTSRLVRTRCCERVCIPGSGICIPSLYLNGKAAPRGGAVVNKPAPGRVARREPSFGGRAGKDSHARMHGGYFKQCDHTRISRGGCTWTRRCRALRFVAVTLPVCAFSFLLPLPRCRFIPFLSNIHMPRKCKRHER